MYVDQNANVRQGPGMNYKVAAIIKEGTKLTLKAAAGRWYKITSGKYKGLYIAETVLTRFKPYKHTFKALYDMNVRKGATAKSDKVGTAKKGTAINSTKKSGDWIYAPKQEGWIRTISADNKKTYLKKIK